MNKKGFIMSDRQSYWIENMLENNKHTIVDLGYASEPAIDRAELLKPIIGKRNIELVGFNRIVARIPPKKVDEVMGKFKIKTAAEQKGYVWCTHTWFENVSNPEEPK